MQVCSLCIPSEKIKIYRIFIDNDGLRDIFNMYFQKLQKKIESSYLLHMLYRLYRRRLTFFEFKIWISARLDVSIFLQPTCAITFIQHYHINSRIIFQINWTFRIFASYRNSKKYSENYQIFNNVEILFIVRGLPRRLQRKKMNGSKWKMLICLKQLWSDRF